LRSLLLDSVTHEFRTPLTSIKASVTSLLSSPNLSPPEKEELLTVIDEESDRLNRLVGEAAEMSQLDAGKVELHPEPTRIRDVVDEALDNLKQLLSTHPVEIRIPDDLPRRRWTPAASKKCWSTYSRMPLSIPRPPLQFALPPKPRPER